MKQIQKLDMAIEQFNDSLEKYYEGHYYSAIVLSGASEQLLAGYIFKHKLTPEWNRLRTSATEISNALRKQQADTSTPTSEKDIGSIMNYSYNHSKHAGRSDHTLFFNPKYEAQSIIERALMNYDALLNYIEYELQELPLAHRFISEITAEDNDNVN